MSAILRSMQQAIAHHQAGRLTQAEALYRSVLRISPREPDALHLVGVLAHQQGRHAEAASQIRAAIDQNNQIATYHNNLGAAERAAGRLERATQAFAQALKLAPGDDATWSNMANALQAMGDVEALSAALDAWVRHCPDSVLAHEQRSAHRTGQGDLPGAIADHQRLADLNTQDPGPLLKVGILAHQAGDDDAAITALENARERFFDTADLGGSTVQSKLDHDIEQIEWLVGCGRVSADWMEIAQTYASVRAELFGDDESALKGKHLDPQTQARIGRWYNRPIHVEDCPARPEGALSPDFDGAAAEDRYRQTQPGITWVDGLLRPEALADLRRFCMGSTIWTDFRYSGGYVGTALPNGFANGLLLQIARELRLRMPELFGPHPLRQMWAYKYDQRLTGIGPHADEAAVNVNFWITPDSANRNPQTGGLVVWRETAPLDWDFEAFNRKPETLMEWIRTTGAEEIHVPYRCNRAVIFDSNLVHRTGDLDFEPGFENRRVNITMLFGQRGKLD